MGINKSHIGNRDRVAVVPRLQAIQKVCGTWSYMPVAPSSSKLAAYRKLYERTDDFKHGLTFTRWLWRYADALNLSVAEVQKLTKMVKALETGDEFILSSKYNDLARLGVSPHYLSCFRPEGIKAHNNLFYLIDPSVCVAYTRDRAGHFVWRTILRLCATESGLALLSLGFYGNLHETHRFGVLTKLQELFKLPVYVAAQDRNINVPRLYLLPGITPPPYEDISWRAQYKNVNGSVHLFESGPVALFSQVETL